MYSIQLLKMSIKLKVYSFLLQVAEASHARLQRLNPMVDVVANKSEVSTLNEEFLSGFDVICATRCAVDESFRINEICRKHNIPFYSGDVFGFSGFFFIDLLEHKFAEYNFTNNQLF